MKKNRKNKNGKDRGSALIVVLSLVALASVLAASGVAISQSSKYLTMAVSDKALTLYDAEGTAARIHWLILWSRGKYPNRSIGGKLENQDEEKYLADGIPKLISYHGKTVEARIYDAASGIDVSNSSAPNKLAELKNIYTNTDTDLKEHFDIFLNRVRDYIDQNDNVHLNGMEKDGYESMGVFNMPRNDNFQFREEILFIPGASDFFQPDDMGRLSQLRIVHPKYMPRMSIANSFFSASKELIMYLCNVSEAEAETIIEARDLWFREGIPLEQTLQVGTYTLLKSKFSFNESGFYTIVVNTAPKQDRVGKRLFMTLRISQQMANPGIRYYEWLAY